MNLQYVFLKSIYQAALASTRNAARSHNDEQPVTSINDIIVPQLETEQMEIDFLQPEVAGSPIPGLTRAGRPQRNYRLPRRYKDCLPEPTSPSERDDLGLIRRVVLIVRDRLVTSANSFGIWRDYPRRPT